jgi:hypothetical protein
MLILNEKELVIPQPDDKIDFFIQPDDNINSVIKSDDTSNIIQPDGNSDRKGEGYNPGKL